jgi:hypothetical protein
LIFQINAQSRADEEYYDDEIENDNDNDYDKDEKDEKESVEASSSSKEVQDDSKENRHK